MIEQGIFAVCIAITYTLMALGTKIIVDTFRRMSE